MKNQPTLLYIYIYIFVWLFLKRLNDTKLYNLIQLIIVVWFQVFLSNTNNLHTVECNASLQRGKTLPFNECPGYITKQSDGEVPAMLVFGGEC